MDALQNWRAALPTGARLYRSLALGLIIALALGLFLFVMLALVPSVRNRSELITIVADTEANLAVERTVQAGVPERVRTQINAAETRVREAGQAFLSEPQAAAALNRLYQYARESGVTIAELTDQTGPQPADASIYSLRTFGLRVTGPLPRLTNFLARIRETALRGFMIADVKLTEEKEQAAATLNVKLYISPAASTTISDTTPPTGDATPPLLPPLPSTPGGVIATPVYTATTSLPPAGDGTSCVTLLANGDFESDANWLFGQAVVPAQYTSNQHYAGSRALQLGYPLDVGAVNRGGYSSSRQLVTIPANAGMVTLRWWQFAGTQEPPLADPTEAMDRQEVLLLTPDEKILRVVQRVRRNDTAWQQESVDLTAYGGQTLYIYFNVFNDENRIPTWLYIDDVRLESCAASPTAIPTGVGLTPALPTLAPTALPLTPPAPTAIPTTMPTAMPTAIPTAIPTMLPTVPVATATLVLTPVTPSTVFPTATGAPSCGNLLLNGGFEGEGGWIFGQAAAPAEYTTSQRYEGARALQFGYPPDSSAANGSSYSSIRQQVTIPSSAGVAILRWWHLYGTQEGSTVNPSTTSDRQEVLLLTPSEQVLAMVQRVRRNDGGWQQETVDLTAYRGQTIYLYFNVFNDNNGLRTWMYVDDVRLELCPPAATPAPTLATPVPTLTTPVPPTNTPIIVIPTIAVPTATPTNTPIVIVIPTVVIPTVVIPTPSPTASASCTNLLVNGDFESNSGWVFGEVAVPAQYTLNQKYEGVRSMQFGYPPDWVAEVKSSYSSIRQQVTIPADASAVTLRWWQLSGTAEASAANPNPASDRQEVLLLAPNQTVLTILQQVRRNDAGWQSTTLDLTPYRGQTVELYFNVYNDNNGLRTWMYVDDVHLELCSPSATPVATPFATPVVGLPAPSFDNCQEDPLPASAPNSPILLVNIDKAGETATLQNVSPGPIDLTGWHLCSIKANQEHDSISGIILPGEARNFGHSGGVIWNNDLKDDGALYNASGQLVSYWNDPDSP